MPFDMRIAYPPDTKATGRKHDGGIDLCLSIAAKPFLHFCP